MRAAGNGMIQDCAALNARLQPAFLDGRTFFANYDHSFVSFVTKHNKTQHAEMAILP
jgi:hypothetical protein